MNIQMVDLKGQYHKIKEEIDSKVIEVFESSQFINGKEVKLFAEDLVEFHNVKNVITCANGTDALQIALMALGLQQGDEVIVPVHTYVATAEVIALLKLKPVFIDVNPETFTIDINQIKNKITPNTKAIVPVHLYGQCADMETLLNIAKQYKLFVVEDTAQAIGAEYKFSDGTIKKAGTMGDIGTLSFFPSKNLGCYGDGGALLINDNKLAEKARMIANHGQSIKYHHDIIGCNSRLDTIQATILRVKLKYLTKYTKERNKVADFYDNELQKINGIEIPKRALNSTHVFHQYTVKIKKNRDLLKEKLANKGIPSMIYYPIPLHLQKAYINLNEEKENFPITEMLSKQVLSLPIHTEMSKTQLNYIINTIKECIEF